MNDLLVTLSLGFFLGMRHATDSDHVVAVTTIVSRERTSRAAVAIGALWGLGHTTTVLAVGSAIVLFGLVIPPRLGLSLEMCVAAMLVVLGIANFTGGLERAHHAAHTGVDVQATLGEGRRSAWTRWLRRTRPFAVGVVHGLAGSAAIALLVLTTIHSPLRAVLYLLVFGLGTVLGMMLLTTLMVTPILAATRRFGSVNQVLARVTGVASIVFGLVLAYRIGVVDGLLRGDPTWTPR